MNRADDDINDRYDQSLLNDIDPDINFINAIKNAKSLYHCDKQFNGKFKGNCNLSLLHSNIRSIARNFSDMNICSKHIYMYPTAPLVSRPHPRNKRLGLRAIR